MSEQNEPILTDEQRAGPSVERVCKTCSRTFWVHPSALVKGAIYCSKACYFGDNGIINDTLLCLQCQIRKPLAEMVPHKRNKLGYRRLCKTCHYAASRRRLDSEETRRALAERARSRWERERAAILPRHNERSRIHPEYRKRAWERSRESGKAVAYREYRKALRNGVLTRPDCCSHCGVEAKVEGHHVDYARPLDVVWLCRKCHSVTVRKYQ